MSRMQRMSKVEGTNIRVLSVHEVHVDFSLNASQPHCLQILAKVGGSCTEASLGRTILVHIIYLVYL